ncbi:MAG: redoxin family protein [Proteobacteria bacterium]|uniref:redoxin family protein n=1 Tax=Rudaea sp. TaxID=2136325 RepID=UPI00378305C6|nr:redoxin family protein [Pseudomonadota bacterium]
MHDHPVAPAWQINQWFNTQAPLDLANLRGRVVVMHAFQMLCPGCVLHAVPQAERIHRQFAEEGVTVIGIHTVFEHHAAMQPVSLQAFLREFGVTHPVGIDASLPGQRVPATMQTYAMQGTPTLILIDRIGCIRLCHFGRMDDLALGAEVMRLLCESG